jgi:hypothetical protein
MEPRICLLNIGGVLDSTAVDGAGSAFVDDDDANDNNADEKRPNKEPC